MMDINSLMASQLPSLQQTVQLSLLDQTLNNSAIAAVELLQSVPVEQTEAPHPYKGLLVDLSV